MRILFVKNSNSVSQRLELWEEKKGKAITVQREGVRGEAKRVLAPIDISISGTER